ncbi:2-keto-3-deoxygluconate permease [Clostridium sp. MT-14]|jgi:2-keto-3-deoxygluconate permease|uniref:2-keto-3-deoxygluconate permease n=1 Tax=unclassified Clostridium TaxID=2614128 RepID=UPI0012389A17|nr:2-keto-3-deoxygluconate permease [Clostridium sp. HV4-5-A1G]KAA8674507.1 2-keto-3-deoxygluconate permease [Clostridium sp. HV4-5-A1G]
MQIKKTIDKVPGGIMIIPLLLGAIVNTFFPQVLMIGGFTTAMFKQGSLPILAVFLFCMGAQMSLKVAPKSFKKGVILLVAKCGIGAIIGLGVGKIFGTAGILGLTPLAIIAAMTNTNGGLFVALTEQYGDKTDVGAIALLSLNNGPFFTMLALGASGLVAVPVKAFIAILLPICLGMLLGSLDKEIREFLLPGEKLLIPFFAFPIGASMNLSSVVKAGLPGILLGVATAVLTGFGGYFALRAFGEKRPIVAFANGSTGGNSVGTPAAIAAVDKTISPMLGAATAQIAASCIISAFLCPAIIVLMNKHFKRKDINKMNQSELEKAAI